VEVHATERRSRARAWAPVAGPSGPALDPASEAAIEEQRVRSASSLSDRERVTAVVLGGLAVVAGALFAALGPWTHPLSAPMLITLLGAYVFASTIEFEVGSGTAIPTQLVLVPMLFCLPLAIVPLTVACGLLLGSLTESIRARAPISRALASLSSSWHAFGPALVFAGFGVTQPAWGDWPIYLVALGAQFAVDVSSSALSDRIALGPLPPRYLAAFGWVFAIDAALAPLGLALAIASTEAPYSFLVAVPVIALFGFFARERRGRIGHALELSSAYRGTALLLGSVIEADDAYTGSHSRDVVELSLAVADDLGLDQRTRRQVEFTALLHDVGKIHVPSEIINKRGPLTAAERAVVERHTLEGEAMLLGVGGALAEIGSLVRSCHERWDGKGYPDRLLTEETPLVSRIVCACDAYNAMTTDRSYRAALAPAEAERELRANAGTQFDPVIVASLLRVLGSVATARASTKTAAA
jgi:HD-GYP domain-containing protein (c-di-GMP phosphodiesterase class II)